MAGRPDISVVIPTRNRWEFLQRAVGAALLQEEVDVEVVVVDDAGTDDTPARLEALADPRIVFRRNERRRRPSGARNAGLEVARGDWIAFLDDDDVWAPRKLVTQLAAVEAQGRAWCYCAVVPVDEGLEVLRPAEPPLPPEEFAAAMRTHNPVLTPSLVLVRRDELRRLRGFDESIRSPCEDWEMWIRLRMSAGLPTVCPDVLAAYVDHAGGIHASADEHIAAFELLAAKHPDLRLDGVEYSRWVAGAFRRAGSRRAAVGAYLWGVKRFRSPGNVVRAVGLIFGERAMEAASPRRYPETLPEPSWLAAYR